MVYIAQDNPVATIDLDLAFEAKAETARQRPTLYKPGRVKSTPEIVVRPNYVMVYRVSRRGGRGASRASRGPAVAMTGGARPRAAADRGD